MLDDLLIFDEIDEEKTVEAVKKLLGNYHSIRRVARSSTPNITSSYSITPRSETNRVSDSTSEAFERKERASKLLDDIHSAINSINYESRRVIYLKYLSEEDYFNYELFEKLLISKDTFYRRLKSGYIEFSESFRSGSMVVYKKGRLND